jgi:hypothetical protein
MEQAKVLILGLLSNLLAFRPRTWGGDAQSVSISAGVVTQTQMPTVVASVNMPAQTGGSTSFQGIQSPILPSIEVQILNFCPMFFQDFRYFKSGFHS